MWMCVREATGGRKGMACSLFLLCHHISSLREIRAFYWLTFRPNMAGFPAQPQLAFLYSLGPLAYVWSSPQWLGPPPSIANQEMPPPHDMSTDQSEEGNSSTGVLSSQVTLGCIKLTIKINQDDGSHQTTWGLCCESPSGKN